MDKYTKHNCKMSVTESIYILEEMAKNIAGLDIELDRRIKQIISRLRTARDYIVVEIEPDDETNEGKS